ncbi:hypothetical protein GCM10009632_04420 [Mycolicibacterium alvei]|uniref:Uncharacterized protein n=2 Tax=Mycolicibacterium alvei TaxID=67081 RepID=A0A6N4V3F7_9MYCO|nr:hypothetical protein [Mycolicibacterium fortuitum]BBX30613.1 hypothetical protein MALV_57380 [Mycolicibacterium alvei]
MTRLAAVAAVSSVVGTAAGCGEDAGPSGHASGGPADWISAACKYVPPDGPGPLMCHGHEDPTNGPLAFTPRFTIYQYKSLEQMQQDNTRRDVGFGSAQCVSRDRGAMVFIADVSGMGERSDAVRIAAQAMQPLDQFGCTITDATPSNRRPSTVPPKAANPPVTPPSAIPPSPSATAPAGRALPINSFGYAAVATKSGLTTCMIAADYVGCESRGGKWPALGVKILPDGSTSWINGNLGDINPVSIDYQVYTALGWTVTATAAGTRFNNDRTGHGAFVNAQAVTPF